MSPGETAADLSGVGGTVVTAPVIPWQSKGKPPSTTGQSFSPSTSTSPLCVPVLRRSKQRQNKDGKTKERIKKKNRNAEEVAGRRGSNLIPEVDANGIPSNLFIHPPLYPTSTGGTRLGCSSISSSNGCRNVCCSPCTDTSLVAGPRDTSLVGSSATTGSTSSPSVSFSSACRSCLSPSVCLCRDYEEPQG